MNQRSPIQSSKRAQRGISLFTVLIMLLLSLTAVLGAFRVANLNEALLGNTSDYARAQAAAEALVRDAEMDIRGRRPPITVVQADGSRGFPCRPNPPGSATSLLTESGYIGCRQQGANPTTPTPWFPRNSEDFDAVSDLAAANNALTRCMQGICVPLTESSLAPIEDNLATMTPFGATYGQYTRDSLAALDVQGNPILNSSILVPARAWYWVEVFRYEQAVSSGASLASALIPDPSAPFVYRITAVVQGLKSGTRVVVKSVFVPYPAAQNK
jgi:type IV pilus assembly protein PilX